MIKRAQLFLPLFLLFASCNNSGGNSGQTATATSGSLNMNFGSEGIVRLATGSILPSSVSMGVQSDGKIIVAGMASRSGTDEYELVRFSPDGTLDQSFGISGIATASLAGTRSRIGAIAIDHDNKIMVVGTSYNGTDYDANIIRFQSDGNIDTAWGNRGQLISTIGADESANGVAVQNNGKVLVVGSRPDPGVAIEVNTDYLIARFNTDGTLDGTFGNSGVVATNVFGPFPFNVGFPMHVYTAATHVSIQNDGKLVVSGSVDLEAQFNIQYERRLVRYLSDGTIDTSFGTSGLIVVSGGDLPVLGDLLLLKNGKICTSIIQGIACYDENGVIDGTFGQGGSIFASIHTYLAEDALGNIVAADYISDPGGFSIGVARFHPEGSPDLSFGSGGIVVTNLSNYDFPTTVLINSDARILLAGSTRDTSGSDLVVLLNYNP